MRKYFTMENYLDSDISIKLENGIVFVDYLIEHATYDIADRAIKMKLEMFRGQSYPVVSDMRSIKTSTRESRQRMSEPDAAIGVKAVAVVLHSKIQKVMFNFFSAINKRPAPAKIFSKKEDAINWAQKFVD
jgi:hypothetical protein